jgi:hypothetical protein
MESTLSDHARRALVVFVIGGVLGGPVQAQAPTTEAEVLAKGKSELRSGDHKAAITTLSGLVRGLRYAPGRDKEAAEGYLYLGLAYVGLDQTSTARSQFVQALVRDPSITLDPQDASPKALEVFAEARKEGAEQGVLAGPKKKSTGTKIAIGLGAVALGVGGAVAAASGSSGQDDSTAPPFAPTPAGVNPFVQLVGANPSPGGPPLAAGASVSWSVRVENSGQGGDYEELILRLESVTADGRPCLVGERGPFSFRPVITLNYNVTLQAVCPLPFQTQTLVTALEVPGTRQRVHQTVYSGVYRFGQ